MDIDVFMVVFTPTVSPPLVISVVLYDTDTAV